MYKCANNNGFFQYHFLKKKILIRAFVTDGSVPTLGAGSAGADAYRVVDTARHSVAVQRSRGQIHHPRSGKGTKA